ncbi:hypothetical protein KAW11_02760 [Candidatus Bathyarchaeota archaeon]|nr:hypothetical protein [Candidatus Bathyarchaeota archaeon]
MGRGDIHTTFDDLRFSKKDIKAYTLSMSKAILIEGECGGRIGAQMTGGKTVLLGHIPSITACAC